MTDTAAIDGLRAYRETFGPVIHTLSIVESSLAEKLKQNLAKMKDNRQQRQKQQDMQSKYIVQQPQATDEMQWARDEARQLKREIDFESAKMMVATKEFDFCNDVNGRTWRLQCDLQKALDVQDFDSAARDLACLQQIKEEMYKDNRSKNYEFTKDKVNFIWEKSPVHAKEKLKEQTKEQKQNAVTKGKAKGTTFADRCADAVKKAAAFNATRPVQALQKTMVQDNERSLQR